MTRFAPHLALKLIARGKMTFDETMPLHRGSPCGMRASTLPAGWLAFVSKKNTFKVPSRFQKNTFKGIFFHQPPRLDQFTILRYRICLDRTPESMRLQLERPLSWCQINLDENCELDEPRLDREGGWQCRGGPAAAWTALPCPGALWVIEYPDPTSLGPTFLASMRDDVSSLSPREPLPLDPDLPSQQQATARTPALENGSLEAEVGRSPFERAHSSHRLACSPTSFERCSPIAPRALPRIAAYLPLNLNL